MRYLVDADFVIDHFTAQPGAQALLPVLVRGGMGLSIVTFIEVYEGAFRSRDPKRAAQELRTFLRGVSLLPISRAVALRTARLGADLRARNRAIQHRAYDIITAATALTHDLTLVTSNTRDYSDIPRLRIVTSRSR